MLDHAVEGEQDTSARGGEKRSARAEDGDASKKRQEREQVQSTEQHTERQQIERRVLCGESVEK